MIDMIAFAISDFYKDVFNQSIGIKTLGSIITKCCGFNKQEAELFEDNFKKLEVNGELPTFYEAFENQQKGTININLSSEPSTSSSTLRF